jgi:IS1 family transposase
MSHTTVIKRIRSLSKEIKFPLYIEQNQNYEMDELWTYCGSKANELYISYAINRKSKQVIDFVIGKRTKENLEKIVNTVVSFNPVKIYTDGLNIYPTLIPTGLHKAGKRLTNHIERFNLTLRTHIKRLVRSTIAFSKKTDMLESCLKLYFGKRQLIF